MDKRQHLHTRIAIRGKSLKNKTFTEKQNNSYLITSVGKIIFNQIFDGAFPFINDSSKENLVATPDKYFVPMGTDIKAHIKAQPLIKPLGLSLIHISISSKNIIRCWLWLWDFRYFFKESLSMFTC